MDKLDWLPSGIGECVGNDTGTNTGSYFFGDWMCGSLILTIAFIVLTNQKDN
ncbi:hypothetical protein KFU94_38245 [Chloroflexi bacterium TSY]|nr:hypothetical protein [Chloroflexi bacterium TSY]